MPQTPIRDPLTDEIANLEAMIPQLPPSEQARVQAYLQELKADWAKAEQKRDSENTVIQAHMRQVAAEAGISLP